MSFLNYGFLQARFVIQFIIQFLHQIQYFSMILGDLSSMQSRPRAPSLPMIQVQVTTVLTACPGALLGGETARTATVQADCSEMHIRDTVSQPLPTAIIQGAQG